MAKFYKGSYPSYLYIIPPLFTKPTFSKIEHPYFKKRKMINTDETKKLLHSYDPQSSSYEQCFFLMIKPNYEKPITLQSFSKLVNVVRMTKPFIGEGDQTMVK